MECGGLSAQDAPELPLHSNGDNTLTALTVLLLQEICLLTWRSSFTNMEAGSSCLASMREIGEARRLRASHSNARTTNTRLVPVGITTTKSETGGKKGIRFLAGHIPHHATIRKQRASCMHGGALSARPGSSAGWTPMKSLRTRRRRLRSHTGRGETILAATLSSGIKARPQQLDVATPTTHSSAREGSTISSFWECKRRQEDPFRS